MSNLFSKRLGIKENSVIKTDEMTSNVRNRLWNKIKDYIDSFKYNPNRNDVIEYLWDGFFKEDTDLLDRTENFDSIYYHIDQIKKKFFYLEWYEVYDFLEFLLRVDFRHNIDFVRVLNRVFNEEGIPYEVINNYVTPLISGEEAEEIKTTIYNKYPEVSGHINKALEFYRKRPVADYKNSIKESISSVEALARIILNNPNGTLGYLSQQLNIHPALKKAIKELYGWTSDEGGIRHSENGKKFETGQPEARFMLIECSALVNYITSKYEK